MHVCELTRDWVSEASGAWTDLLRQSNAHAIFMSWAWTSSWIETLGEEANAKILGVYQADRLIAILPLSVSRPAKSIWGKRLLLGSVDEFGADYSDLLCVSGFEAEATQAIAEWLIASGDWVQCEFRDVLQTALVRRVAGLMNATGAVEDRPGSKCPRTSLIHGWKHILRERFDQKRRYNIVRQLRLAEEKESLRMVFHETPDAVSRAFPVLVRLHNERKTSQRVHSSFSQPQRLAFHAVAAAKLSESGSAFIATLESPNEIVSAAYCFRDDKSVYYFQTGMSAAGAALGAGSTLLYLLLRSAADQGYQSFDFLQGEEDYKRAWATDYVDQRVITITRAGMRGAVARAVAEGRRALSRLRKYV